MRRTREAERVPFFKYPLIEPICMCKLNQIAAWLLLALLSPIGVEMVMTMTNEKQLMIRGGRDLSTAMTTFRVREINGAILVLNVTNCLRLIKRR